MRLGVRGGQAGGRQKYDQVVFVFVGYSNYIRPTSVVKSARETETAKVPASERCGIDLCHIHGQRPGAEIGRALALHYLPMYTVRATSDGLHLNSLQLA